MSTPATLQASRGRKGKKHKQTGGLNIAQDHQVSQSHKLQAVNKIGPPPETTADNAAQPTISSSKSKRNFNPKSTPKRDDPTTKGPAFSRRQEPDDGPRKNTQADKFNKLKIKQLEPQTEEHNKEKYRKMLESYPIEKLASFMQRYGLDDPQNYLCLCGDLFVKEIGSFYYCALCCERSRIQDRTIDQHLESKNHVDRFLKIASSIRQTTPHDNSIHSTAADMLCDSWISQNSLTEKDRQERQMAIDDFTSVLNEMSPECSLRMIGSFLTGATRRDSDVNLELLHPNSVLFDSDPRAKDSIHHKLVDPDAEYGLQINNHTLQYDLVSNAVENLHKIAMALVRGNASFNVTSSIDELTTKVPEIVLEHVPTKTVLKVCCYADSSYRLSCLIRNYLHIDERALQLCILAKHWASICNIANPKHGTLSPDTIAILVIHFLQRTKPPVLPCLHELYKKNNQSKNRVKSNNDRLEDRFQSMDLNSPILGNKESKETDYIDPKHTVDNNAGEDQPGKENSDDEDELDEQLCSDMTSIKRLDWSSKNTDSIRKLFINFLKFFMSELSYTDEVISIRRLDIVPLMSKRWNTQIRAIENPVQPKINLTRTIGSPQTFDYIISCFAHGFYYLTSLPMPKQSKGPPINYSKLYINLKRFDFYFRMKESQLKSANKSDTIMEMVKQNMFSRDIETISNLIERCIINNLDLDLIPRTVFNSYDTKHLIPSDIKATLHCWFCKKNGHTKERCPDRVIDHDVNSNQDYLLDQRVNFDGGFLELYTQDMISAKIAHKHRKILDQLTQVIRTGLSLNCSLSLFGSTVNLLGSHDSDLDICMTLDGNLTGKGVDCVGILENVCGLLENNPDVINMEPILAARVPIIRFRYRGYDVDLCMYNQCAIHNSQLLRAYVMIDFRLAQLYYLVKRCAKSCNIADASKGSLSSYAWSLLTIHFLQQTTPPMLPVLQEPPRNVPKTMFGVGGWNVWFNQDIDSITMPKRTTSLTTLYKEFLLYYTRFDFSQRVISIRTSEVITKFQKNWNNCMIAIEDPFELTYNLSGRLDDQMATYIMKSFPRTYRHINRIQNKLWSQNDTYPELHIVKGIFDGRYIMDQPPPYRGCRRCHKIGHRVVDCPLNNAKKQQQQKHEQRQQPSNNTPKVAAKGN